MNVKQRRFLDRAKECILARGFNGARLTDLTVDLGVPYQAVKAIVDLGVAEHEIFEIADGQMYTSDSLREVEASLREFAMDGRLSVPIVRDHFQSSRSVTEALLEYLDSEGTTVRGPEGRTFKANKT